MGPPPQDAPESAKSAQSFSTIAARAASNQPSSSKSTDHPRNWTVFRKRGIKRPQAPDTSVKHQGVLCDDYLVEMILSHLRDNPNVLSKLSRVSPLFHEVATQFLWSSATIRNLVKCAADPEKLSRYASFVTTIHISSSHDLWPEDTVPSPIFTRLKELSVCGNAFRGSSLQAVTPMFTPSLRQLQLWTTTHDQQQELGDHLDRYLLSHISTTCQSLTTLSLESHLRVSSADFSTFIAAMGQLKALRLGRELNSVLSDAVMVEVFSLPHLEDLSSDLQLDQAFVTALRNDKEAKDILPRVKTLEVTFSEGGGLAPALLLAVIPTVEQLWMTLAQATEGQAVSLHPATFEMLGLMRRLVALQVQFQPGMQITYNELAALSSLPSLKSVHISRLYRHGDPRMDDLLVSGDELAAALLGFSSLESLWLSIMPARINATYEEAQIIDHRLAQVYPGYQRRITLVIDEVASFGWPSFKEPKSVSDEPSPSNRIWQASSKNFSPDPIEWTPRNLNLYTDNNGRRIPLQTVVTDGAYNHLTDHVT
ncbi:hypothetical protein KCU76_g2045, partial [Aureobasidium melanogenum]